MSRYKHEYIEYDQGPQTIESLLQRVRTLIEFGDHHTAKEVLVDLQCYAIAEGDEALQRDIAALYERVSLPKINTSPYGPALPAGKNNLPITFDEERLKSHFNFKFKGQDGGFPHLMEMLGTAKDSKRYAQIAFQIYNSPYFVKGDFRNFASWYQAFCDIVGCEYVKSYKPSKLKLSSKEAACFYFLEKHQ